MIRFAAPLLILLTLASAASAQRPPAGEDLAVEAALDRLRRDPFRDWSLAAKGLSAHARSATAPLLETLVKPGDADLRAFSAWMIGELGLRRAASLLASRAFSEKDAGVRFRIAQALARLGDPRGAPALRRLLESTDSELRLLAARGLGAAGNEEDVRRLKALEHDADPFVRLEAKVARHLLGDKTMGSELRRRVLRAATGEPPPNDPACDPYRRFLRLQRAAAIGRLADKPAQALLERVLTRLPFGPRDPPTAAGALLALTHADPAGDLLGRVLDSGVPRLFDLALPVVVRRGERRWARWIIRGLERGTTRTPLSAIDALGRLGGPAAAHALGKIVLEGRDGQAAALGALGRLDPALAAPYVMPAATSEDDELRAIALQVLGRARDAASLARLVAGIDDPEATVRRRLARALSQRPESEATRALVRLLDDADAATRRRAWMALERLDAARIARDVPALGGRLVEDAALAAGSEEQRAAREALAALRPDSAFAPLLRCLRYPDAQVRERAYGLLLRLAGRSFAFDSAASESEREAVLATVEAWWTSGGKRWPRAGTTGTPTSETASRLRSYSRRLRRRGLDLIILFDSTGSMGGLIAAARHRMQSLLATLERLVPSLRASLITYRDRGDAYEWYGTPLTRSFIGLDAFLQGAQAGGGGDFPEGIGPALHGALDSLQFRPQAEKVIVLIGDAPYHANEAGRLLKRVRSFCTEKNRARLHTLVLRHGAALASAGSVALDDPTSEAFTALAEAGRGLALGGSDANRLLEEIVVLAFGEEWREAIKERELLDL